MSSPAPGGGGEDTAAPFKRRFLLKLGIQTPHLHIHIYPVSREATREDVMDAIDGRVKEERSSDLAARLTRLMS